MRVIVSLAAGREFTRRLSETDSVCKSCFRTVRALTVTLISRRPNMNTEGVYRPPVPLCRRG